MTKKIEWYQEVLALEPGSRIFFPLAKLFAENGQHEDAVKTLRQGLDRHPDNIEARLLLIQLLARLEHWEEASVHLPLITKPLERYPAFWSLWAQRVAEQDRDFAVFLMLAASHFTDKPLKWTDVLIEGLGPLTERLLGPLKLRAQQGGVGGAPRVPMADMAVASAPCGDDPYTGPKPDTGSFRTRTMADLLASQGDFVGALGIYRELWGRSLDEREKQELTGRIRSMEDGLADAQNAGAQAPAQQDPFGKHAKNRLMSTLEALASRLEARVRP